jgi:3-hydroxyisobutyrate dehydrogenase
MIDKGSTVVGFIGTGVMGRSMAGHILDAGYTLRVHNRTKDKATDLIGRGAIWASSPAEIARESDVIVTIVGYPTDVQEVYLGDDGLVANAKQGALLIDMTTSSPELAEKIHHEASLHGARALDAPVSGGDVGAREARLSIMVGGDHESFEEAQVLFALMGNAVYQGPRGSGQKTKMANQIAIAAGMLGVCEALAYSVASGLDPKTVLSSIENGAAGSWSLSNLGPRMLAGNFDPGFYVKHFIKDMRIAIDSAAGYSLDTPGLELALSMYEELSRKGLENLGTQALYKLYGQDKNP